MSFKQVGRYALVKLIGRGGMADVWIGKSFGASGFEKIVAVKLLAPDNVEKEDFQRALMDEARVLVSLKHPNIVDVYDLNFEAENPYLVMEYVEGIELRDLLKALRSQNQRLPLSLVAYLILEVSKALSHAHETSLQIVHRDVSPSNILISSQGDVKLSDFGIAKSSLQSNRTQTGLIKGKFRYMSPEQAAGKSLDHRSDIFSLGLVLYECLFGVPAYSNPTDVRLLQMAARGEVSFPSDGDPEIRKILEKLLARKPSDRFQSLTEFRKEWSRVISSLGGIGDREAMSLFLNQLNLSQLQQSMAIRRQAEEWNPLPTSQILIEDGKISTLADISGRSRWYRYLIAAGVTLLIAGAGGFFLNRHFSPSLEVSVGAGLKPAPTTQGSLQIETSPPDALVQLKYGDITLTRPAPVELKEIPFAVPVSVTVSKKGYNSMMQQTLFSPEKREEKMKISLTEVKGVQVNFIAEPYAEVTVPGKFSDLETPTGTKALPPGNYEIRFFHPPTGRLALTNLRGGEGGVFICSADMAVGSSQGQAVASCRKR